MLRLWRAAHRHLSGERCYLCGSRQKVACLSRGVSGCPSPEGQRGQVREALITYAKDATPRYSTPAPASILLVVRMDDHDVGRTVSPPTTPSNPKYLRSGTPNQRLHQRHVHSLVPIPLSTKAPPCRWSRAWMQKRRNRMNMRAIGTSVQMGNEPLPFRGKGSYVSYVVQYRPDVPGGLKDKHTKQLHSYKD